MESPREYSYSYRESSYSLVSPIFTLDTGYRIQGTAGEAAVELRPKTSAACSFAPLLSETAATLLTARTSTFKSLNTNTSFPTSRDLPKGSSLPMTNRHKRDASHLGEDGYCSSCGNPGPCAYKCSRCSSRWESKLSSSS